MKLSSTDGQDITHAISSQQLASPHPYTKEYKESIRGQGPTDPAVAYPEHDLHKKATNLASSVSFRGGDCVEAINDYDKLSICFQWVLLSIRLHLRNGDENQIFSNVENYSTLDFIWSIALCHVLFCTIFQDFRIRDYPDVPSHLATNESYLVTI